MKIKKNELKGLAGKELEKKLQDARAELIKLNAQIHGSAPPKNPHALRDLRRTIARLLTQQKNEVKR